MNISQTQFRRCKTSFIDADPYPWPYNGALRPDNTALIIIDMQTDFCGPGGYVDHMGYDLSLVRAPIEPIKAVLAAMRARATISSTRARGTGQTLPTCPPTNAGARSASTPASAMPVPAVAFWYVANLVGILLRSSIHIEGEAIIDKPGKGSFCATDLELILKPERIENIILTGITTDVCVHTTMREANDRGFECLLLEDCCGATDYGNHLAAINMVKMQGGVFGSVSNSSTLVSQLP